MRAVTLVLHVLGEALISLRREGRQMLPMSLGIVWGMASVMVLLAVATGFERSQEQALSAYGILIVLVLGSSNSARACSRSHDTGCRSKHLSSKSTVRCANVWILGI